jgi:TorA maturation chaperone TorD
MEQQAGHTRATSPQVLILQEHSSLAHWLAGVLAGEPGAEQAEFPVGNRGEMQESIEAISAHLEKLETGEPAPWESERVRLFVNARGGIPLPPYGSWWIDGELMGPSSVALTEFYRQEGLRSSSSSGPPDFIGAELEFLHFLLQHQIAAMLTHQDDLVAHAEKRERDFLNRFLLPWMPRFCEKGLEVTKDRFWSAIFTLLTKLVETEKTRITTSHS